jgi:hypothetical protein
MKSTSTLPREETLRGRRMSPCLTVRTILTLVMECADMHIGHLSVPRASILKHAMRSMHRMMQASGNAEGLRGLIDSSLLKSLKKVMEQRTLFGPSVLAIGTCCLAYAASMYVDLTASHQHDGDLRPQ